MTVSDIESRFKEVTGLTHVDMSVGHMVRSDGQQQKTSKIEYKLYGYVTTPLWLVDEMLEPQMDSLNLDSRTCDACSGCGQFSIRLMRKFYNRLVEEMGVSPDKADRFMTGPWLKRNHYFTEFQFSNVAKLIYIFGPDINVYVGDSLNMKFSSSENTESGLLFFNSKNRQWMNLPDLQPEVEKRKDDLDALVTLFKVLESTWNLINASPKKN